MTEAPTDLAMAVALLEKACGEIIERRELEKRLRIQIKLADAQCDLGSKAVEALEKTNEDLGVMHAFWKSACERALRLWEAEAEKNTQLLDAIELVLGSTSTAISREHWALLEGLLDE